jgi:cardiolipin synthase
MHEVLLMAAADDPWSAWDWLSMGWTLVWRGSFALALLSVPSVLVQRRGRPQAALGWLLLLVLLPPVGLFFWWAIGRRHLIRRRRKKRRAAAAVSHTMTELRSVLPSPPEADWDFLPIKRLPREEAEWVFCPTTSNYVELLVDAAEAYPAIEQAILEARHHVHLLFYIWRNDATGRHFRDLLAERANEGVQVRLLLDAVGASDVDDRFMSPLIAAGARVRWFQPPRLLQRSLEVNFRNHRKIVVADDRVGILGGLNIGDEYCKELRDTALRIEGPAVDQLQEVFAEDWYFSSGEDFADTDYFGQWRDSPHPPRGHGAVCGIVPSGPHTEYNFTHEAFFIALNRAEKRIWITTPYFIPDQTIVAALRTAVFRGVDVRLLVPERSDHLLVDWASRSFYPVLLQAGVRIFHYSDGLMHAKTILLDDDLSIIGSANLDLRSFRLNFEISCFVESTALAGELQAMFERFVADSREISWEEIERASPVYRVLEAAAHLLSPLL